jgi:MFS family permease
MAQDATPRRPPESVVAVLACVTLTAYGSWIYSFGVLLDDLVADLGTGESSLLAAFGAAQLIAGVGSVGAGRLLDRRGSRPVFAVGAAGAALLAATALAGTPAGFLVLFAVGAGSVGATGFYHVSQTVAARLAPGWETHAITRLTLYASFSASLFYPMTAWLVGRGGWQLAVAVSGAITFASFVAALAIAPTPPTDREGRHRLTLAGFDRSARRYAVGVVIATGTVQLLSVYQVPVMVSAGISLGAASVLAGGRGIAQFLGRLPLPRIVARLGAAHSLRSSIALMAVGAALLSAASSVVVAGAAMLLAGLAIGAQSPLVGIRGREVFDERILGTALGSVTLGTFVSGAVAPMVAGALVDATGARPVAVVFGAVLATVAAVAVGSGR